jgi:hypothetical protein
VSEGVCRDVAVECDNYNPYDGNCISCASPATHALRDGQCVSTVVIPTPPVCLKGTHLYENVCISDVCKAGISPTDCTSCINAAFDLVNGTCLPKRCPANQYYSAVLTTCVALPAQCTNFSLIVQSCLSCTPGYFLYGSLCVRPTGSNYCKEWDFLNNRCKTC